MRTGNNTPGYRAGDWLIISGQTGRISETVVEGGFEPQFKQALSNLGRILAENGLALNNIAKVNIYLKDMSSYSRMNELYLSHFGNHRPARTVIGVSDLNRNAVVEIEAWAYAPSETSSL